MYLSDWNGGAYSKFDERHQNDPQYFSILQHLRKNDFSLCQSHKPDDNNL